MDNSFGEVLRAVLAVPILECGFSHKIVAFHLIILIENVEVVLVGPSAILLVLDILRDAPLYIDFLQVVCAPWTPFSLGGHRLHKGAEELSAESIRELGNETQALRAGEFGALLAVAEAIFPRENEILLAFQAAVLHFVGHVCVSVAQDVLLSAGEVERSPDRLR